MDPCPSPARPEGVYVYRTHGFEKTDALTGVTHRYPARSTITVTGDPCGFRLRWDVLEGRSTTWTVCVGPGRVVARETLRFGGMRVETVHVRRRTSLTGSIRGRSTQDAWLARESGVPVRLDLTTHTTNDSAVGDVHYEEDVVLRLTSLEPRR